MKNKFINYEEIRISIYYFIFYNFLCYYFKNLKENICVYIYKSVF